MSYLSIFVFEEKTATDIRGYAACLAIKSWTLGIFLDKLAGR